MLEIKFFGKLTSKGHNVEFIKGGVPEGVEKFKSKYNKDVEFKFDVPGIYAYWCTPHKSMGMIGLYSWEINQIENALNQLDTLEI